jgi:uncharacterized linocin/CFP29 family protein
MTSDKNHKKLVNRKIVTTARRLVLEKLHARELLAGDVTAAVTNGFLVVRGDDAANELTIERVAGDKVRVTGATGTTINGLTQPAILRVRKGYDISTGGGDDKLTVIGLNAVGRYEIRMDLGAGNDVLVANNLLAQRIHAGGGNGNDSLTIRNSRSRRGSGVGGGAGDDTMVLENLRFGNGSCIDGGTGKNTVQQSNNRFGVRFTQINTDPNAPSDLLNVAPVANNDTVSLAVGGTTQINVLSNDTDSTGAIDPKTVVIVTQPTAGTASVNATTGVITYTHNGSSARTDSLTYTVKDDKGLVSNVATVSISITQTDRPPTSVADSLSVVKGGSTTVNLANNDTAGTAAINRNSIVISTQPTNGTLTVGTDGNVTYQHNNSSTTSDSFAYTIKDVNGLTSAPASVSVTVTQTATPPTAVGDSLTVVRGASSTVNLANNDTAGTAAINRNSIVIASQPANGSISIGIDGNITYQHNNTSTTSDSFTYTIKDVNGLTSAAATVAVTVTPAATAPTANPDSISVANGASVVANLANNDTAGTAAINRNSIVVTTQPTNGTVTVGTDGNVTYLHNGSTTTSDTFAYTIKDINGLVSGAAIVSVTIAPVNSQAPVAANDTATVAEGSTTTISILSNDTAPTGGFDLSSIVFTDLPTQGTIVKNADGSVAYTHSGNESASDSFKYTVKGTNGVVSNEATVTITITRVNDAPVANNDTASVVEGGSVNISVLSNDTDIEGNIDVTSVVIANQPAHGTVGVNSQTGVVNYVHNGGPSTSDSFTYTFRDAQGAVSNAATVSITIQRKPIANDDTLVVQRGGQSTVDAVANDTAPSGTLSLASVVITKQATHGSLSVLGNGQIQYLHDGSNTTSDTFDYTVADSNGNVSLPGTVNVTITPVNTPPVAQPDIATVVEGQAVDINVLANDTIAFDGLDPTSVTIVTAPTRGTAVVLNSGAIRYTHSGSETTSDFLIYTVRGNNGLVSQETRVDITITPANDGPTAGDDQASVQEGGVVNIPVLANDSDSDNAIDASTVVIVNTPTHGSAVLGVGGVVEYTHDGSESTADSFTYRVSDVSGKASNLASVSISITPVNDPPVAVNDNASIPSNIAAIVDLAANDFDLDDGLDLASIVIENQPTSGTLTVQTDGKVSYVHDGSEATSDLFTYRIRDKSGQLSNQATVSLTITLVNQPPIAVPDSATIASPGGQVDIDVSANDSDPDGGLNLGSVVIITPPSHGTAVNLGNGSIRYTHNGSEATSDSFTYKIRDFGGELSNEATVTITVAAIG